jgi:hypothetical protein
MTASNDVIYLWGGRGGKEISPLSNGSIIHTFDVARSEWDTLLLHQDEKESEQPEDRSYHSLTSLNVSIFLISLGTVLTISNLRIHSTYMPAVQLKGGYPRYIASHWTRRAGRLSRPPRGPHAEGQRSCRTHLTISSALVGFAGTSLEKAA